MNILLGSALLPSFTSTCALEPSISCLPAEDLLPPGSIILRHNSQDAMYCHDSKGNHFYVKSYGDFAVEKQQKQKTGTV